MKILLSNDDGILSPGLLALAKGLCDEHELTIVAPDSERSAVSHAITFTLPLRVSEAKLSGLEHIQAYAVSGTPADCVKVALGNLCEWPDMVISGINIGANKGTDVFYSGTVSAAMEGALMGIPSIAISNISYRPNCFEACVEAVKYAVALMAKDQYRAMLMNVNAPDTQAMNIKGFVITPAGKQCYELQFYEREDPRRQKYYWAPVMRLTEHAPDEDSDERWTKEGYVSITPLLMDMTDHGGITRLRSLMDVCENPEGENA